MKEAYDTGISKLYFYSKNNLSDFFDNAEAYAQGEAEKIMGRTIKRAGWNRESLVISTKLFWGGKQPNDVGLSRKHLTEG